MEDSTIPSYITLIQHKQEFEKGCFINLFLNTVNSVVQSWMILLLNYLRGPYLWAIPRENGGGVLMGH
jgi:hypothetical protein